MMIFKLFAVVCALAVPHDECVVANQNDRTIFVYELPLPAEEQRSNIACLRRSMFIMAPLGIAPRPDVEYMKSVCTHETQDAPVG